MDLEKLTKKLEGNPLVEKVYREGDRIILIPRVKRVLRSEYFILNDLCDKEGYALFIDLEKGILKIY